MLAKVPSTASQFSFSAFPAVQSQELGSIAQWAGEINGRMGTAINNWAALVSNRLNLSLPKDGSEPMTGTLTTPSIVDSGSTAHGVLIGEAASAIASVAPGTAGQVLTSNGAAADPSMQTPSSIPAGLEFPFAGPLSAVPAGYLLENGQAVSRTTYVTLFGVIGTTYGAGDGSTTFNVPNLSGAMIVGVEAMGGIAAVNKIQASTTITTTAGSATATVGSANGIAAGMFIRASTIPTTTTVNHIIGTTVTLSTGVGVTAGTNVAARFSIVGDAQVIGQAGGADIHTQLNSEVGQHNHSASSSFSGVAVTTDDNSGGGSPQGNLIVDTVIGGITSGTYTPSGSVSTTVNNNQTNVAPMSTLPYVATRNWIIKT